MFANVVRYRSLSLVALDLRAIQREFLIGLDSIVDEELTAAFGSFLPSHEIAILRSSLVRVMDEQLNKTTTMDNIDRMTATVASSSSVLLKFFTGPGATIYPPSSDVLSAISKFQSSVASQSAALMDGLRKACLSGEHGPAPASPYLGRTKAIYEFIRKDLGIRMHGSENLSNFANGLGVDDVTIGQNISRIFEVCRSSAADRLS
jgi:phenylalanine ammonia-lyase